MKILYIFLFAPLFLFSQTELERKAISKATNNKSLEELLTSNAYTNKKQDSLKQEYIKNNKLSLEQIRSLIRIDFGRPIFYGENNVESSISITANAMYPSGSLGLNVTGQGMIAGVWDGGKVRDTHRELTGRVTLSDVATTLSPHATHVTGTIIGSGVTAACKGLAYDASVLSYDWTSDTDEITAFATDGYLVSNHSYGYISTNLAAYIFGSYDSSSFDADKIAFTFPYYQMVKAAGNDRGDVKVAQATAKNGYDLLTGECNSKNVLTVAATERVLSYIDNNDVVITSFSNFGPTDDGRVKPDIAADGNNVYSCVSSSNVAYDTYSGTSMAAPSITGLIVLLQKHYNNLNAGTYMKSATVRGLLCHSAREAGSDLGPDYSFGWGLADGSSAAQIISNKGVSAIIEENKLLNAQMFTKTITVNSVQDLKFTASWTDPQGRVFSGTTEDVKTPQLVNNLDLKVLKDGVTYYPWKLNLDSPIDAASNNSDNDVDNIEKVEIPSAQPGTYTIQITNKGTLKNGFQDFTLIASGTNGLTLNSANFISDNTFFVYPNPATDVLNFTNTKNVSLSSISINDITGKVVYESNGTVPENSIAISNLQQGVYFVKFTSDSKTYVKKFVKQ